MSPLIVWLTRPNAHEIYMGGDRRLDIWVDKPSYLHGPRSNDRKWRSGKPMYVDMGWMAPSMPVNAKPLLRQDKELDIKVWRHILLSCAPRGMDLEQATKFSLLNIDDIDDNPNGTWRDLYTNRQWEDCCNTPYKRFLLEIDLRSNDVQRIMPTWSGRGVGGDIWHTSDEMGSMSASEYHHPEEESDGIPF